MWSGSSKEVSEMKPDKAKTARKFGVQIADSGSIENLDNIAADLEEAYGFAHIYSHDYEKLKGYIRHRRIVLKHTKPDVATRLDERIDIALSPGSIDMTVAEMYDHNRKGSLSDADFAFLHSKACRKIELLNNLKPNTQHPAPSKEEVAHAANV